MLEDKNNEFLKETAKTADEKIDTIAGADESLMAIDTAQFDLALESMSQTLANIDDKMDVENLQLQKLDQLSGIKEQLNRLENTSVTTTEVSHDPQITAETINEIEEEVNQGSIGHNQQEISQLSGIKEQLNRLENNNVAATEISHELQSPEIVNKNEEEFYKSSVGHNQQEISELLEKIDILEKKMSTIENQSNNSGERFRKIESVMKRFEDLENELPNLFKNLFKKKEKIESNEKDINIDKFEIQSETAQAAIPKNIANIIEEAEKSTENATDKTLILSDLDKDIYEEDKKPKAKNLKFIMRMFLFLGIAIATLFFLNNYQIINLNFDEAINSGYSLIDLIFEKVLFYLNLNNPPVL
jgi:chromosome segregation ATPase